MTQPATAPALPANVRVFEMAAAIVVPPGLVGGRGVRESPITLDNAAARRSTNWRRSPGPTPTRCIASCVCSPRTACSTSRTDGGSSHSEMSRTLRTDHPTRTRAAVRMLGSDGMCRGLRRDATRRLADRRHRRGRRRWANRSSTGCRTSRTAAALFNDAMIGIHGGEPPAVAAAYPFAGTVIDVGGGSGNMIVNVLQPAPAGDAAWPTTCRTSCAEAQRRFDGRGPGRPRPRRRRQLLRRRPRRRRPLHPVAHHPRLGRGRAACGSSSTAARPRRRAARCCSSRWWCRRRTSPHPAKMLDLVMLAVPGGRERTPEEYRALLAKAGLTPDARSSRRPARSA